jgi:hypothetical protein
VAFLPVAKGILNGRITGDIALQFSELTVSK